MQSITPIGNGSLFSVTDVKGNTYTTKKIVLGTGMKDILPATPGVEDAWGKGMYWCPWNTVTSPWEFWGRCPTFSAACTKSAL